MENNFSILDKLSKNSDLKTLIIIFVIALIIMLTIRFLKNIYTNKKRVKEQFTNY
jgi:hypothetical protein